MNRTILRAATVSVATAGLAFATLAPASAQSVKIHDTGGSGALNIKSAKLSHQKKRVVASAKVSNLKKRGQVTAFRFKTSKGGYIVLASFKKIRGGSTQPSTNTLYKYTKRGVGPVKCKKFKTAVNVKKDRAKVSIPRTCLGKPKKVSVKVQTGTWPGNKKRDETSWSKSVKRG